MNKTCSECSSAFRTDDRRRKFCSVGCYRASQASSPNAGAFRPGIAPWNKGTSGLHLSPDSEFKLGQPAHNHAPVGAVKIRWRARENDRRAWVKVAEPNRWRLRSVLVWESVHGPLGRGLIIHHLDRDSLNDAPENLRAMTRAEHLAEHREEFSRRGTGT